MEDNSHKDITDEYINHIVKSIDDTVKGSKPVDKSIADGIDKKAENAAHSHKRKKRLAKDEEQAEEVDSDGN